MTRPTPDLRYPIGQFSPAGPVTRDRVDAWIADIPALPADLRRAVEVHYVTQVDDLLTLALRPAPPVAATPDGRVS